jgi:hypothetical protein
MQHNENVHSSAILSGMSVGTRTSGNKFGIVAGNHGNVLRSPLTASAKVRSKTDSSTSPTKALA